MEIVIMEAVTTGLHLMELPSSNICSIPVVSQLVESLLLTQLHLINKCSIMQVQTLEISSYLPKMEQEAARLPSFRKEYKHFRPLTLTKIVINTDNLLVVT